MKYTLYLKQIISSSKITYNENNQSLTFLFLSFKYKDKFELIKKIEDEIKSENFIIVYDGPEWQKNILMKNTKSPIIFDYDKSIGENLGIRSYRDIVYVNGLLNIKLKRVNDNEF